MAGGMVNDSAFLCIPDQIVDDFVRHSQLPDFFLHCVLKHVLLLLDQGTFLLVVNDTLLITSCPVATPPISPGMLSSCTAVCSCIDTLFKSSGTLSAGP